jgi:hypothetical protein
MGEPRALVEQQILMLTRTALEQGARPIDRPATRGVTLALFTIGQPSCAGSGIRPRVRSRANA